MAMPTTLRVVTPSTPGMLSLALPVRSRASGSRLESSHCNLAARGVVARNSRISQLRVAPSRLSPSSSFGFSSSTIVENRLRVTQGDVLRASKGGALGAVCAVPFTPENLRWVVVAASAVLLYVKGSGVQSQFLAPLLAIEVPRKALGWLQGDYGLWVAFISLAVKIFNYLPAELELPLYIILIIITAPLQITQYRGTQAAAGVSVAIAAFLGYQHYQKSGTLQGAFRGESIFPSIAIVLLVIIPLLFLINGSA